MKSIGLLIIVVAFSGLGWEIGRQNLLELKKIKNADAVLTTVLTGLENGRQTIHEIFYQLKNTAAPEEYTVWDEAEKRMKSGEAPFYPDAEALLFGKDQTVIENIGYSFEILGQCSAEEQIEKIRFYRENIKNRYRILDEPFRKKTKLFQSLGVLGGLFLAVILL